MVVDHVEEVAAAEDQADRNRAEVAVAADSDAAADQPAVSRSDDLAADRPTRQWLERYVVLLSLSRYS